MFVEVAGMSACGSASQLVLSAFVATCWLTEGAGKPPDSSAAEVVRPRPLCHLYLDIWDEKNDWHGAGTLKTPLCICHCQGFSDKVDLGPSSNTNTQLKHCAALLRTQWRHRMKGHFSHSPQDMTYVASFSVHGPLSDTSLARFPPVPCITPCSNGRENRKLASNRGTETSSGLCSQFNRHECLSLKSEVSLRLQSNCVSCLDVVLTSKNDSSVMKANERANASWPADQDIAHTNCKAPSVTPKQTDSRRLEEQRVTSTSKEKHDEMRRELL